MLTTRDTFAYIFSFWQGVDYFAKGFDHQSAEQFRRYKAPFIFSLRSRSIAILATIAHEELIHKGMPKAKLQDLAEMVRVEVKPEGKLQPRADTFNREQVLNERETLHQLLLNFSARKRHALK